MHPGVCFVCQKRRPSAVLSAWPGLATGQKIESTGRSTSTKRVKYRGGRNPVWAIKQLPALFGDGMGWDGWKEESCILLSGPAAAFTSSLLCDWDILGRQGLAKRGRQKRRERVLDSIVEALRGVPQGQCPGPGAPHQRRAGRTAPAPLGQAGHSTWALNRA